MKILHVITSLQPSTGGPPRVVTRLAAGQVMLGHDVTIASQPLGAELDDFRAMTRLLPSFDRVRLAELKVDSRSLGERVLGSQSRPQLEKLITGADVVHIHNVWESVNRVAASIARRLGKPYFIQPNDMLNPYSLGRKRLKKQVAMALGYRRMIDGAAALLFGHSEERRLVQTRGFRTKHLVLALGGVFEQEVEPLPAAGRFYQRYPVLAGRPFVVFLSRLNHKKGLDFLAEGFAIAAAKLPEVQLVVIGHDEGAKADFEERIAKHGLQSRVHLVGPMHGESKWEAYRDAVCFCLPSRDEAFTVAITEALAAGLPVVISENCHYDDVGAYEAGVIVPLDAQAIGAGLVKVLNERALRDQMAAAAKKLFRERLSFDTAARESIAIYEEALRR